MSTEAKPIGISPNIPELTAQTRDTVQESAGIIKKKGDALDQLRRFRRIRSLGPTTALGVGLSGAYTATSLSLLGLDSIPGYAGFAGLTVAASYAAKPLAQWYETRKATRALDQQRELSEAAGSKVELYRWRDGISGKRKKHLDLRWYGVADEGKNAAQFRDQLAKVAAVGNEAGVETYILPYEQVATYLPTEREPLKEFTQTQTDWLYDAKRRALHDTAHGDELLLVISPEGVRQIIDNIEVTQENQPLQAIMRLLQRYAPQHPSHMWFEHYSKNPDEISQKLLRIFQQAIDQDLEDAGMKFDRDSDLTPRKQRVYRVGTAQLSGQADPSIIWRSSREWHDTYTTDLLASKNLTIQDFQTILMHPDAYPPGRVTEVCEIAAWLTLQGRDIGLGKGEGLEKTAQVVHEAEKNTPIETLQQRVVDRELGVKKGRRRKKAKNGIKLRTTSPSRRLARSAAALVLAGGLGYGAGVHSNYVDTQVNIQATNIMNQLGKQDGYSSFYDDPHAQSIIDRAFAEAQSESPFYQIYNALLFQPTQWSWDTANSIITKLAQDGGLQFVPNQLKNYVGKETQTKDCAECDAQVGNVENVPNQPVWYLQPYNGMQTAGYWSETVFNLIDYSQMAWKDPSLFVNPAREKAIADAKLLGSPTKLDMSKPLVSVQRAIDFGAATNINSEFAPFYNDQGKRIIPIPVLNGTHVDAAIVEGVGSARLATFPDGTQALVLPGDVSGVQRIEYWLSPGDGTEVHATGPIQPSDVVTAAAVDPIWDKYLKRPLPTNPKQRLTFEKYYIEDDFDYELDPLPNENVIFDRAKYVNQVLSDKDANCNVANSLLAISNPTEVNPVTGFLNSNSTETGQQYLSGNESHLWTVTQNGTIEDATPTTVTPQEAKKEGQFFAENFGGKGLVDPEQQHQEELWRILEGLGLLTAAGSALWQRRRLQRGLYALGAQQAELRLRLPTTEQLALSYDALNHTLYAGPDNDLATALARRRYVEPDRETILQGFSQYAGPDNIRSLLDTLRDTSRRVDDPTASRALTQARKVVINIRNMEQRTRKATKEAVKN